MAMMCTSTHAVKFDFSDSRYNSGMDLRELQFFRVVMQTKSMTMAATQLHTSQPNVSRAIARLQRETGLHLFKRVGLRLVPTPEAEALLREVERCFVGVNEIREAAETIRTSGAGGLRVAANPAMTIGLIPDALRLFRKSHPSIFVSVQTADAGTLTKWTAAGLCDFALATYFPDPHSVEGRLLHRSPAVCLLPQGHRLARKRKIRPADLAGESFISIPVSEPARQFIDEVFRPDHRHVDTETTQAVTICLMVARGLGVTLMSPVVYRALAPVGVVALPFEPAVNMEIYSLHARDRVEQAAAQAFLASVRLVLADVRGSESATSRSTP